MSAAHTLRPVRDIPMDWRIVRFDDTRYYGEDWLRERKITRCLSYYIYDKNRHVHLCEITPSYELWKVSFDFESAEDATDEERETAWGDMLDAENGDEDVTYMHVSTVDRFEEKGDVRSCNAKGAIADEDLDDKYRGKDEPAYHQTADELREHYSGNSPGW